MQILLKARGQLKFNGSNDNSGVSNKRISKHLQHHIPILQKIQRATLSTQYAMDFFYFKRKSVPFRQKRQLLRKLMSRPSHYHLKTNFMTFQVRFDIILHCGDG